MEARGGKLISSSWRRRDTPTSLAFYLNIKALHEIRTSIQNRKLGKKARERKEREEKGEEEIEEEKV